MILHDDTEDPSSASGSQKDETVITEEASASATAPETRTWTPQDQHRRELDPDRLPNDVHVAELPAGLRTHQRYRIIRRIGGGGMGDVYLAEHRLMRRAVAVKTIRLDSVDDPALEERFLREVRANAKLSHPNIVSVHDAEHSADILFLVMEYLEGEDLLAFVSSKGRLDPPMACKLLYQATAGVQHAHDHGVVHRDIKPSNLLLVRSQEPATPGVVKVLDFGLAKVLQDAGVYRFPTPQGFAMGTRGFMSPEQAADARSVGIRADIFSLGRTLYYLLSGKLPYRRGMQSLLEEESGQNPVTPLHEIRPDIPDYVNDLVQKMTATEAEDRFGSCAEVLAALSSLCGSETECPDSRHPSFEPRRLPPR
jgi:serine/threonine protein kinase